MGIPGQTQVVLPVPIFPEVVQLTTTLSMGGSAQARVLYFDGSAWRETSQEITVHDVVGSMEGTPGKRGLAWFHRQSGLWLLWQLECRGSPCALRGQEQAPTGEEAFPPRACASLRAAGRRAQVASRRTTMTGGYPCCCPQRLDSSVSGAGSFPLPGSWVLSCYCRYLCGGWGPESWRVDVHIPGNRLPPCSGQGGLPPLKCPDFSGTYFVDCVGSCFWASGAGEPPGEVTVGLEIAYSILGYFSVYVTLGTLWHGESCSDRALRSIIEFRRTIPQEQASRRSDGSYCLEVEQLHGLVLPHYSEGLQLCPEPNATATIYLPN